MNRVLTRYASVVGAILALAVATPAVAQQGQEQPDKSWKFSLTPMYLWFTSISGTTTVGDFKVPIDSSFGDIFDRLDFAFTTHFEAMKDRRFGIGTDFNYYKLSQTGVLPEDVAPDISATVAIELLLWDIYGFYTLGEPRPDRTFQILAGARTTGLDQTLTLMSDDTEVPAPFGIDETWTDFIVGARLFGTPNRWFYGLRYDLGGGSGFTSNLQGLVGYQLVNWLYIQGGYKWLKIDYDNGLEGIEFFAYDVNQFGPIAGLTFVF